MERCVLGINARGNSHAWSPMPTAAPAACFTVVVKSNEQSKLLYTVLPHGLRGKCFADSSQV